MILKINNYWPAWEQASYFIPGLGKIPVLNDPALADQRCEEIGNLLDPDGAGLLQPSLWLIKLADGRRFVAHRFQISVVSYSDYVFSDLFTDPKNITHSGVHSPAITLDPRYDELPIKRLYALKALEKWGHEYRMARRAIEWCAANEDKAYIREEARDILRRLNAVKVAL